MANRGTPASRRAPAWTARPPAGWEPVAEVCRRIFEDLPAVVDRLNAVATREVRDLRPSASMLTNEDLDWATVNNVTGFLHGVAENRAATAEEIAFRSLVGRRSAIRGLPLQSLIAAYQLGIRELWSILVERAEKHGDPAPKLLLTGGSTIFGWMLQSTNALSEGYLEELARREALAMRTTAHFLDVLVQDPGADECRALASEIGFDPAAEFRVLVLAGITSTDVLLRTATSAMEAAGAVASSAQRGRTIVVVVQGLSTEALDRLMAELPKDTTLGVGLATPGLEGARASLSEAERALELSVLRGGPCRFDRDWLPALALTSRGSLERLLAPGIVAARRSPHLADAVRTFAACGFSIAETARRLNISQNSARYRLVRWEELTGWNPWGHDGLSRSMLALELSARAG